MNSAVTLIAQARALDSAGHVDASAAVFAMVLQEQPGCVEAMRKVAVQSLRQGNAPEAVGLLERALQVAQEDPQLHHELHGALESLVKGRDAQKALDLIVAQQPYAYCSDLYRARLLELRGETRQAVLGYLRSIRAAQSRGFWLGKDTTPPWLLGLVTYAMGSAQRGRLDIFQEWLAEMHAEHGRDSMNRVANCMSTYLGAPAGPPADPRQRPSFLYFPGLPATPFFDRSQLPFAALLEDQTAVIRAEMLGAISEPGKVGPFHGSLQPEQRELLARGAWDALFFFKDGERLTDAHQACPATSSALAALPLDHVPGHGPEVCFSIMRPGTHILPHSGVTNTRSVVHLGLVIPPECALKLCAVGQREWREGQCFAFDDTFEHEAWNHSDRSRVILLCDIWNPNLDPAECAAISSLIGLIAGLNSTTQAGIHAEC